MPAMPYTYALDPTGLSPDNLVSGEVHALIPNRNIRTVASNYGGFYAESLVVVNQATGLTLTPNTQYYAAEMYEVPTAKYGKMVCSVVIVTDPAIVGPLHLTYQAVGGEYSRNAQAIVDMINSLDLDNRPIAWPDVIAKPTDFPPSMHLHDAGDIYGFEYVVHALERIRRAIEIGDDIGFDNLYRYLDQQLSNYITAAQAATAINTAMALHLAAPNPHPQYQLAIPLVRAPAILTPVTGTTVNGLSPTITASKYYSLYGLTFNASQWQVSTSVDFTTGVYDTGTIDPNTFFEVPVGALVVSTAYHARVRYQDDEGNWSPWSDVVNFSTGSATVATPTITAPGNNSVAIPETPTLTSSVFAMSSGVDTQAASEWEIWTAPGGTGSLAWASGTDPIDLLSVTVPAGSLSPSTQYYARVRYKASFAGLSQWSADIHFTTAAFAISGGLVIGSSYGGGTLAGFFRIAGQRYALVVSPRTGGYNNDVVLSRKGTPPPGAQSLIDGFANTAAMIADDGNTRHNFPAARWARNLNLNGFHDWYIPSRDEQEMVFRAFKPTTQSNQTGNRALGGNMGNNANSDPNGVDYTTSVPGQTSVASFQINGAEALDDSHEAYWTSSFVDTSVQPDHAWRQRIIGAGNGGQSIQGAGRSHPVRAIRRVAVSG